MYPLSQWPVHDSMAHWHSGTCIIRHNACRALSPHAHAYTISQNSRTDGSAPRVSYGASHALTKHSKSPSPLPTCCRVRQNGSRCCSTRPQWGLTLGCHQIPAYWPPQSCPQWLELEARRASSASRWRSRTGPGRAKRSSSAKSRSALCVYEAG